MKNFKLTTSALGKVKEVKHGYYQCAKCGSTSFSGGQTGKIAGFPFHRYVCNYCGEVHYIDDKALLDNIYLQPISHNNQKLLT